MWKKEEAPPSPPATQAEPSPRPERSPRTEEPRGRATIGPSISIKGEVTGDEDLLIQGRIDGSVDLKAHSVTVGPEGKVKAGITGRIVVVEGTVEGDLLGTEQVILRKSAAVHGDITSPRVVLEDGARFRGGVDMGSPSSGNGGSGRGAGTASGAAEGSRGTGAASGTSGASDRKEGTSGGSGKDKETAATSSPAAATASGKKG